MSDACNVASSHQSPPVSPIPSSTRLVPGDRFAPRQRDGSGQRDPYLLLFAQCPSLSSETMVTSRLPSRNEGTLVFRTVRTDAPPPRYGQGYRTDGGLACRTSPTIKTYSDAEVTLLVNSKGVFVRTPAFSKEARNLRVVRRL